MKPNPFQALPESVKIGGQSFPINTDFRVGVAIETEMEAEKPDVAGLLLLFYNGRIPKDVAQAVEKMLWFYTHHDGAAERPKGAGKGGKWYDFTQDADALLASFLDAYGVDISIAKMHWWVFRRLMLNLPPETPFMQRVKYRTADLKKLSKAERKHYKKMRELYALKKHRAQAMTPEERDAALKERVRKRYEEAQKQIKKAASG